MSESNNERKSLNGQSSGTAKRVAKSRKPRPAGPNMGPGSSSSSRNVVSCGACKYLRRKCAQDCIFAPHFDPEQGGASFAAIHKVFGASNLSKLLMQLPPHHRQQAVLTVSYEAQARLQNPVGGCVSEVFGLMEQVVYLQIELARVQNQLVTERLVSVNALRQQVQPVNNLAVSSGHHMNVQPMNINDSFAPNKNMVNMNTFDPNMNNQNAGYAEPSVDPVMFTELNFNNESYDVEGTKYPFVFGDQMF